MVRELNLEILLDKMPEHTTINWAHFGNGISVWNPQEIDPRTNDYRIVAHISAARNIELKVPVDGHVLHQLIDLVATKDPTVSVTQTERVFNIFAKDIKKVTLTRKYLNKSDSNYQKTIKLKR